MMENLTLGNLLNYIKMLSVNKICFPEGDNRGRLRKIQINKVGISQYLLIAHRMALIFFTRE